MSKDYQQPGRGQQNPQRTEQPTRDNNQRGDQQKGGNRDNQGQGGQGGQGGNTGRK